MNVIIELLIATVLAAAGQVSWKLGMRGVGAIESYDIPTLFRMFTNWQVDLGLALYAISTVFWLSALSKKDLSYAYPFIAGTYIFVLVLSYLFLGENFGIYRVIGAGVVLAGLFIIIRGG
ncbi:multidrug resistance protein [Methanocella sp. CWC-04]|uniref:Multidrug resistance protein n=1 Tax=Methanooceanicella nereidis TaxID=2052831 RepID=A0AAP2W6J4_9EURY|nr:EamA family transporter [Methanocella sp. CWC-04]MCD1294176.1 multidrug resistance protein [Methanocella sp. CWC-04]